jgi:superfamily II DNA or RNA helicase
VDGVLRLEPAPIVRARIAAIVLGAGQACARIGGITLKPHQQSAVARLEAALAEFGGVLLCDDVGMGKTFVATALAHQFSRTLVVAPAALGSMWRDSLATTETSADFVSFERLSRRDFPTALRSAYDLVIVDEAHHARNPATRRYRSLAKLTPDAAVLLVTATPIHNRTTDMSALLSLFLGSRARRLTDAELGRCVVRREQNELAPEFAIPTIARARHRNVLDNPGIVQELMSLPPPLPVRDGGLGGALIGRGLVHQWASSEAALHEAVRRRIAKAAALTASLESGNYPTARELQTWIYEDGALQLGFPELLSSPTDDAHALLVSVRSHSRALQTFYARHRSDAALDTQRAEILLEIRNAHPKAKIVAFAQYAETVSSFFSRLSASGRVAMLTARGGVVAGGRLTREEVLARFAPRALRAKSPSRAEQIDLLLTTDLLSEGVNLQDAEVVIHLDVPWTAARMEQRVGRVARMGSLHARVYVYLIRPPPSAAALLESERLVQRKWSAAKRTIGSSARAPFVRQVATEDERPALDSIPAKTERLRGILESWRRPDVTSKQSEAGVASVRASLSGFVAAVFVRDRPLLLASLAGYVSADLDAQLAACRICQGDELATRREDYEVAIKQIHAWFEHDLASASAGVAGSRSRARIQILNRIDSAIHDAPPHIRTARSEAASRARSLATSQLSAAAEAELESLAHSPLPDQEWLARVAELASTRQPSHPHLPARLEIHALLLMREAG